MTDTFPEQSRNRLLQAAVEVFADKGFQTATVREICNRAEANVAAVNYYFRNKENLYVEALNYAFQQAHQRYPMTDAANRALPPEQRLQAFVRTFLSRILDDSALGHHGKLIAREIADPTNALDGIVQTVIRPVFGLLSEIVPLLLGFTPDHALLHRCNLSILGQCLMFKHSRSIIDRMSPDIIADRAEIDRCAEHITRFSLLALQQLGQAREDKP